MVVGIVNVRSRSMHQRRRTYQRHPIQVGIWNVILWNAPLINVWYSYLRLVVLGINKSCMNLFIQLSHGLDQNLPKV